MSKVFLKSALFWKLRQRKSSSRKSPNIKTHLTICLPCAESFQQFCYIRRLLRFIGFISTVRRRRGNKEEFHSWGSGGILNSSSVKGGTELVLAMSAATCKPPFTPVLEHPLTPQSQFSGEGDLEVLLCVRRGG